MSKLSRIKAAVEAHERAKEERRLAFKEMEESGTLTIRGRKADDRYNSNQDAAMMMLKELLPILEIEVMLSNNEDYGQAELDEAMIALEKEVKKLVADET